MQKQLILKLCIGQVLAIKDLLNLTLQSILNLLHSAMLLELLVLLSGMYKQPKLGNK